jgi:hypothetical protein
MAAESSRSHRSESFSWQDAANEQATPDAQALEAAVRAAIDAGESLTDISPAELEALRQVVRRWRDEPLVLEPVAVAIVAAIIEVQYRHLSRPPEFWHAASTWIAAVLFETPSARARLEILWRRLVEVYGSDQ